MRLEELSAILADRAHSGTEFLRFVEHGLFCDESFVAETTEIVLREVLVFDDVLVEGLEKRLGSTRGRVELLGIAEVLGRVEGHVELFGIEDFLGLAELVSLHGEMRWRGK